MRRNKTAFAHDWPLDPEFVAADYTAADYTAMEYMAMEYMAMDYTAIEGVSFEPVGIDSVGIDPVGIDPVGIDPDALDPNDDREPWASVTRALGRITLFDGLPPGELAALAAAGRLSTTRPRQLLESQDAPVRQWQVLVSGHVLVQRDGVSLGLLGAGDSWSEHSLLNRHRSPISVVALSPATTLSLADQHFWALVTSQRTFGERVIARSASSADRLALPFLRALMHLEKAAARQPTESRPG